MPKSAQQKFNEYLDECQETRDAINRLEKASRDNHGNSYAYACGVFSVMLGDVISQLPKAKRAEMRQQMLRMADKQEAELMFKTLKEIENV